MTKNKVFYANDNKRLDLTAADQRGKAQNPAEKQHTRRGGSEKAASLRGFPFPAVAHLRFPSAPSLQTVTAAPPPRPPPVSRGQGSMRRE